MNTLIRHKVTGEVPVGYKSLSYCRRKRLGASPMPTFILWFFSASGTPRFKLKTWWTTWSTASKSATFVGSRRGRTSKRRRAEQSVDQCIRRKEERTTRRWVVIGDHSWSKMRVLSVYGCVISDVSTRF